MIGERRDAAAQVFVETVDDGGLLSLADADAHHLARVLRLRRGERVVVSDGAGRWRMARFAGGSALEPEGEVRVEPRPAVTLTVGIALVKGDRVDWAVQKLTELGIDKVVLLAADRSVVRWDTERLPTHLQRLQRVAREAAMQSRAVYLPEIVHAAGVAGVLSGAGAAPGRMALAEPGATPLIDARATSTVLVGPEGGWSEVELDLPLHRVGLPGGVLRTETAAVTAGAILAALRGIAAT